MILLFLFGLLLPLKAVSYTAEDTVIFDRFLQYAGNGNRDIIPIARFFIDTPYVGGTLEGDSAEQLRVNLREQDCVTLVENVLVLHLMLQSDDHNFGNFCRTLQQIRYRNGSPDGYLSRLHYTSEWLDCNRRKGIIGLPELPQCVPFAPNVSFMSAPAINIRH